MRKTKKGIYHFASLLKAGDINDLTLKALLDDSIGLILKRYRKRKNAFAGHVVVEILVEEKGR